MRHKKSKEYTLHHHVEECPVGARRALKNPGKPAFVCLINKVFRCTKHHEHSRDRCWSYYVECLVHGNGSQWVEAPPYD